MNATAQNLRELTSEQNTADHNASPAQMGSEDFVPESTKRPTSGISEASSIEANGAESTVKPRRPRGFAAMDRDLVSAIARKGGKAAHEAGTAHEFTSDEARSAGRKGGQATHAKRRQKTEPAS